MFDIEKLNEYYNNLSAQDGMSVVDFQDRQTTLFALDRNIDDLNDYRLGIKPWKKLRDEITPVSRFLKFYHIEADRIRFPLDNNTPDCWLLNDSKGLGIEVTIESGREQYYLTKEMIETSIGRGFIGIHDDAPQVDFDNRMSRPRVMYTTDQALDATKRGILRCLSKKNDRKYKKIFYLLIMSRLNSLPKERYGSITEELSQEAKKLPFQEVHIIGNTDKEPWGFQIK